MDECKQLIKDNNLINIQLPSGRAGIKDWEELKNKIQRNIKT